VRLRHGLAVAAASLVIAGPVASPGAPGYEIAIVAGDAQRVVMQAGAATFEPLVVHLTDGRGRDAAGIPVRFACLAPHEGCYLASPQGGVSATVSTGRDGRAVLGTRKGGVYVYWTRQLYTRKNPSPVVVFASSPSGAGVRFRLVPVNPYSLL